MIRNSPRADRIHRSKIPSGIVRRAYSVAFASWRSISSYRDREDAPALRRQVRVGPPDLVGQVVLDRQLASAPKVLDARRVVLAEQAGAEVVRRVDEGAGRAGRLGDLDRLARPVLALVEIGNQHQALGAEAVGHRQLRARSEALEALDGQGVLPLRFHRVAEQPDVAAEPGPGVGRGPSLPAASWMAIASSWMRVASLGLAEQIDLLGGRLEQLAGASGSSAHASAAARNQSNASRLAFRACARSPARRR